MLARAKIADPTWYMALMDRWNSEVFGVRKPKSKKSTQPLDSEDDQDLEDEIAEGLARVKLSREKAAAKAAKAVQPSAISDFEDINDEVCLIMIFLSIHCN